MPEGPRYLAFSLLVVIAGLGGFFGYRAWQVRHAGAQLTVDSATQRSARTPDVPVASPDPPEPPRPAIPETVPDVKLPDMAGKQKSVRDYLGHPLIINFWATWCGPCRREIPLLQQLRTSYHQEGLEILGIAVDFESAVADYLKQTPISYPLLVGQDQGLAAAQQFGMELVLPFSVFADAQGRVITVKVGELHKDEADYILGEMRRVDAGKISLKDARADITDKLRILAVERAKAGNHAT
jgi:thiol-disulfide isomerase/thioredoxin